MATKKSSRRGKPIASQKRKRVSTKASSRKVEAAAFDEKVAAYFAEIERERRARRSKYLAAVSGNPRRPPLERARRWLQHFAENCSTHEEQEALIYCRSRGIECSYPIEEMLSWWRSEADRERARARSQIDVLRTHNFKEFRADESDPMWCVSDFWFQDNRHEDALSATMLRTIEWFGITEFNEWFESLARYCEANSMEDHWDSLPSSLFLFNFCRSRLAIDLLREPALHVLKRLEHRYPGAHPNWVIAHPLHLEPKMTVHNGYLAGLIFGHARIAHPCKSHGLVDEAVGALLSNQRDDGSWSFWGSDAHSGCMITAMAMTALLAHKSQGGDAALKKASRWLLAQQNEFGYWEDKSAPNPHYLTVLVMDALEAVESTEVPCRFTYDAPQHELSIRRGAPRFRVALSFAGEQRTLAKNIADELARRLGQQRVLYDKYYEAEFARPNLDTYLQKQYLGTPLIVVVICDEYQHKEWCGLEWRAVRELIKTRKDSRLMFLRHGAATVEGLMSYDGYIQVEGRSSEDLAGLVMSRLEEAEEAFAQT